MVIKTIVAGHEIAIGIEATEAGRKADLTWVDGMLGKHMSLPTDKLVLVSESGFSAGARRKAEARQAVPLSLEDLKDAEAEGLIVNKLGAVFLKLTELRLGKFTITAGPADGTDEIVFDEAPPSTPLFLEDGAFLAPVSEAIRSKFNDSFVEVAEMINLRDALDGETENLTIDVQGPIVRPAGDDHPEAHACVRLDEQGSSGRVFFWPVLRIAVKCVMEIRVAEIPLTHAKVEGLSDGFSFGEGKLGEDSVAFIVDESEDGPRGKTILDTPDGPIEGNIIPVKEPPTP